MGCCIHPTLADAEGCMSNRRKRKEFSKAVKVRRFDYCEGKCEGCGAKLRPGQFDYDHDLEDVEGGDNSFENCRVICKTCHKAKNKERAPHLAKSRRLEEKHIGITKQSGWNRTYKGRPVTHKIGGGVVYEDTGEPI